MNKVQLCGVAVLSSLIAASTAQAGVEPQFLIVPDATNDRVMLFSAFDGSLVNADFLTLTNNPDTPFNAIEVNGEIWVSDFSRDRVDRYSAGGSFLGSIGGAGGLDRIRGIEVVGDTLYITNGGTANGAPGLGVVTADVNTHAINGFFATGDDGLGDPFDVLLMNGELLINDVRSNADGGEDIDRFDLGGSFFAVFHDSDGSSGIDEPNQMTLRAGGNVLAAGLSSPGGVYEYDGAGNQLAFHDVGPISGVHELANGNIMFTSTGGVFVLDPNTGGVDTILGGVSAKYIELTVIPAPGALALMGCAAALSAAATRRRRS